MFLGTGKTAHVELREQGQTNLDILHNTRYLEVRGIIIDVDENGDCEVLVNASTNLSLIEPSIPIWKYLSWVLIPIAGLFLFGLIWVKAQRNRADSLASSIKVMHNRLVSTYQAIDDAMLAIDHNQKVLIANSQFCELIGRELKPGSTFDASACSEFLSRIKDRDRVEQFILDCNSNSTAVGSLEVELTKPQYRSFDLSCEKIVGEDRESSGKLMILKDRTSERQLQAELIHSNKIEAVGQLVGGIAHDFNNILTTITANLSLLNLDTDLDSSVLERVTDTEFAASRGTELVRRLLTYTGKTKLNPEPHSINSIIRELHKFAKATFDSRFRFDFELDSIEPSVHVDSGSIEQVILNIYLNARDAMPNGGKIQTQTKVVTVEGEPRVRIRITDTGPGIPDEIQSQIFEPFFTTKAGQAGTGLGLSTSKRLILEQDGQIDCVSTDQGCCFEIMLPIQKPLASDASLPQQASIKVPEMTISETDKKGLILVVDDEDGVRKVSEAILEMHGFDVLTAVNGESALAVLQTEHQRIDMVLLDMTMPGMPGLDVLKIASKKYPDIPVVLCSGYLAGVSGEIGDECLKLPKPFSAQQLIAIAGEALKLEISPAQQK